MVALFKYTASFQYPSSENNKPIEDDLFIAYPCPIIGNRSAPPIRGEGNWKHSIENLEWQLTVHYIENGENVWQVEVDNGVSGEFVEPRVTALGCLPATIRNTSHGLKVWSQTSCGEWNWEENRSAQGSAALYQNEIYRIEVRFLVSENQADEVTLANDQGVVWVAMPGYTGDNTKVIDGRSQIKFLKWTDTRFQTVFENSETEWESLLNEWQGYRLGG